MNPTKKGEKEKANSYPLLAWLWLGWWGCHCELMPRYMNPYVTEQC